ncbi:hypothetical protein GGR56DRAFT_563381 [Xylariaceae sp. FL0804]|nr:hypothetical protein GGR56DRAFT_563381 [Xylariaceae sp. FL0804]
MVTFNLAYTAPVNPDGAAPVLTQAQVWEGLKHKVRHAEQFVPVIEACEVLSESTSSSSSSSSTAQQEEEGDSNVVVERRVRFAAQQPGKDGSGSGRPARDVRETCTLYAPCRVVFEQEDGSTVTNVLSRTSPGGDGGELMMSYVFEWRHPGVKAGSAEAEGLEREHWQTAKMAVESSIKTIRRMVQEGSIH